MTTTRELQDAWLRSQQLQGSEPRQLRALQGVAQWQVYFYRGNAWSNCQSSADVDQPRVPAPPASAADAARAGAGGAAAVAPRTVLPSGVRIVLDFAARQRPQRQADARHPPRAQCNEARRAPRAATPASAARRC